MDGGNVGTSEIGLRSMAVNDTNPPIYAKHA